MKKFLFACAGLAMMITFLTAPMAAVAQIGGNGLPGASDFSDHGADFSGCTGQLNGGSAGNSTFRCLIYKGLKILSWTVPILISLALVAFMWGVLKYILPAGDEGKMKEGRQMMIYGIIGIAVMVSVWGLVNLVIETVFGTPAYEGDVNDPGDIGNTV